MSRKAVRYFAVFVLILLLASLACGDDNTGSKIDEREDGPTQPPPTVAVYGVGDVIAVSGHTIALTDIGFTGDVIKANFLIENTSAEEINVSSMMAFSARDSEGTKLDQEIFDCGSSLDGKILAGDKLKGDICWNGATGDTFKIYYEASLFGSGAVVWEVHR